MSAAFMINPGSGRVAGRTCLAQAWKNIRRLRQAVMERSPEEFGIRIVRVTGKDDDGRYLFRLEREREPHRKKLICDVDMPGCPFEVVSSEKLILDGVTVPRLYVGEYGSSWWWKFAIEAVLTDLGVPYEVLYPPRAG